MPVFLVILKTLAVIVAVVIILLLTALILPLGFAIEYRPTRFRVAAVYGPWRKTIWAHRLRNENFPRKMEPSSATEEDKRASEKNDKVDPAFQQRTSSAQAINISDTVIPKAEENTTPAQESFPSDEEEEELPSEAMGRLERMLALMEEDPQALGNCVLGHVRWLHRHSVFKIHVRHAYVFWTVTGQDAAGTAIAYGAEMAALNTALALVQQTVHLQSDCLWLEPDFIGNRRQDRKISCVVSASAVLMIHLLYRIWKDPLLQPAA